MRLIDADAFIKKFKYSEADTEDERIMCATARRMIREQPTAYDLDNVVEQLLEKSFVAATSKEFYEDPQNGEYVAEVIEIKDAIEIVKAGGMD